MNTELLVTLLFLISIFGIRLNESAESSEVLCRVVRNLRKDLISQLQPRFPEINPSNCAILHNCSSVNCSLPILNQGKEFVNVGFSLNWCDANQTLKFWSNSSHFLNSFWEQKFSVTNKPQKFRVPWNVATSYAPGPDSNEPKWNLTVNLYQSYSPSLQQTAFGGKFVSLDALLEICQGINSCSALLQLKIPPLSLSQVCDDSEMDKALTPKLMDSLKTESLNMNIPKQNVYTYSHAEKSCALDNPFSCGNGGSCRKTNSAKENQGVCECLDTYEYSSNGSCIPRKEQPVSPPSDEVSSGGSSAIWGGFFAILFLIVLGAFIFYGVRYNMFTRIKNRLPLNFNFRPFGRPRVVQVNDQVSMANPLYDSDDPPLL